MKFYFSLKVFSQYHLFLLQLLRHVNALNKNKYIRFSFPIKLFKQLYKLIRFACKYITMLLEQLI